MPKSKGINEKKAAGLERKAANKAAKDAKEREERDKIESAEWKKGSNTRSADRAAAQAAKADEQARKRAEKAALLAEEEASMKSASSSQARKAGAAAMKSKKKNKAKNSLSLLEESLVSDAEKKAKAAKRAKRIEKEKEERERMERERKQAEKDKDEDPLMLNTKAMLGNSLTGNSTLNVSLEKGEVDATGIDSALSAMSVGPGEDAHPEKRMKALHKAFEEKMMPEMKEQYPGLKRSQYNAKIFVLWKKSPENPMNWPKDS